MKVYLETSVIGGSLDKDEPKFRKFSNELFKSIKQNINQGFISTLVLEEISKAPTKKKIKLDRKISRLKLMVLEIDEKVLTLARKYTESKLIPEKFRPDAIHIAIATVNSLDILASWNQTHIVKPKTINGVNAINRLNGFKEIKIVTPEMVIKWQEQKNPNS